MLRRGLAFLPLKDGSTHPSCKVLPLSVPFLIYFFLAEQEKTGWQATVEVVPNKMILFPHIATIFETMPCENPDPRPTPPVGVPHRWLEMAYGLNR